MTAQVVALLAAVDESKVNPGVLGFLVVALLGVATWLLIRSMHKQLGKVDFEERDVDGGPDADERADTEERGPDRSGRQG